MEVLSEIDMSVVTTTASNSEYVEYSASNNAKTSEGEHKNLDIFLDSDKENLRAHETNANNSDDLLEYEREFLGDHSRDNFSEYNCSETEAGGCEELVMMVPDLDSTLKFKHDTERFFMTLSIAEAELDLAKSASRASKLSMGGNLDIDNQDGASCLKEIKSYVEELLETITDVRESNFGIQRVVEECSEILHQSISQSDLSQKDTTDMNALSDQSLVSSERLKLLCEAITEENSRLKKEMHILSKENEFLASRVSPEEPESEEGSFRYFRRNPLMRFFFFIFILTLFSPGNHQNGIHSNLATEKRNSPRYSSLEHPLKGSQPSQGSDLQLLQESLKSLKFGELSSQGQPEAISICSMLSELDVLEKCFTRIRLS
ncbi:transmembrane domain-containing protein [Cryptosporidium canis]|uniref:Transmembrane domain-containing protein n=1 Tax=Cryptosporidium canis TaxID=195482 RepID=A0ABQ8P5T4_9CRYT|nr:transmembrane domain-containing protein [Cryptosporidium canis]KAJ1612170.1 transmembrane domain-containing protein [Cryptosporidium canis]